VAERAFVQELRVHARTSQPPRDGGWSKAEDACGSRRIQPFSEGRQHHSDLMRGSFQTIQRRVASSAERGAALLAAERLDALGLAMLAISQEARGLERQWCQSSGTAGSDRQSLQ